MGGDGGQIFVYSPGLFGGDGEVDVHGDCEIGEEHD